MPVLTIGLTGGIASGKSWVSSQFEALGVPLLDADQVARDVVVAGSPGLVEIAQHFGADFIAADGTLDRRRMRSHVFGNEAARRELEAILHPRIYRQMQQWRDACVAPYCILSVAILLESRMRTLVDRVLVVDAPEEVQLQRLTARDGITLELAISMMAAQTDRSGRLAAADDVIRNDGSPEQAHAQVRQLHQRYLEIAAKPRNSH